MSEHRQASEAVNQAVRATIQRIKAEITSHPDPETLNEIRAAFRREIPLHLRSYAAALLILESSGGARSGRKNDGRRDRSRQPEEKKGEIRRNDGRKTETRKPDGRSAQGNEQKAQQPRGPEMPSEETRPRFKGEGTTVFFGMGKRQRLYPRVLLRILTEEGGLSFEEIGDIRSFDNYSFADLDPLCADGLIAGLDGKPFRGRGLPVSKARKRGAAGDEEMPQSNSGGKTESGGRETESPDEGYDQDEDLREEEAFGDEPGDEETGFEEKKDEDFPGDEGEEGKEEPSNN